jgi:hypothetical protein
MPDSNLLPAAVSRYQPSRARSSVASWLPTDHFSAGFEVYWQAALSLVCATDVAEVLDVRVAGALRACTTAADVVLDRGQLRARQPAGRSCR